MVYLAYKTQEFLHTKMQSKNPCFLLKMQIAPMTYFSHALSKPTYEVYRKVFTPNPRGIFEILTFLGIVHCKSHSMCRQKGRYQDHKVVWMLS
jgi:hypothetical protein